MQFRFSIPVVISLSVILILPTISVAAVQGTLDFNTIYYHVEGQRSMSFYPPNDVSYLFEGDIDFSQDTFSGYEAYGNILYRFTDDRIVDPKHFSFERIYFGLTKEAQEILLGDFYSNFSEYSLNNAIKGAKFYLGNEKTTSRLLLVAGVDTTKWEDLWENRCDDSADRRYVWGARLENNIMRDKFWLNLNYAGAREDQAYKSSLSDPIEVNLFSLEAKYIINDYLTANTEFSQSFADENVRSSQVKTKSDAAKKISLDFDISDYTATWLYSRVGNHFVTTGGFLTQGLETINFDGTWYLPWKIKCVHYLRTDRDNISDTDSTSTKQINPGVKFSFDLPLEVKWEAGSDMRKRYSSDKSVNKRTNTYTSILSRDFGIVYSTFGYTRTIVKDRINSEEERSGDEYSLGLDGTFSVKEVEYFWNIEEIIAHDEYRQAEKGDLLFSTILGVRAQFPSTLSLEAKVALGENDYYTNETDSYTTSYYFSLSRKLRDDLEFAFIYERRGYNYFDADENYAETIINGRLTYQF